MPGKTTLEAGITDEQRKELALIGRCNPDLLLTHITQDTNYDAKLLARVFELAKERATALLAATDSEQSGELKSCPFCNSSMTGPRRGYYEHAINDCLFSGFKISASSPRDIAAWNRRVGSI